jgi:hypothetical protein
MGEPLRMEYEEAVCHVAVRGNERQAISRDDADRARFMGALAEARRRTV